MKTLRAKFARPLVVALVGLLGRMMAQSLQDKPNFESLAARGRAIASTYLFPVSSAHVVK